MLPIREAHILKAILVADKVSPAHVNRINWENVVNDVSFFLQDIRRAAINL